MHDITEGPSPAPDTTAGNRRPLTSLPVSTARTRTTPSVNMSPKYKVTYFNIRALGEPIRLLLSYGGAEFEDNRIEKENWLNVKPTTPFGKLPLLEVDGKVLHQSLAICRYLGKQFKLVGDDDWESLQVDIAADTLNDFRQPVSDYFRSVMYGADAETQAKKKDVAMNETLPYYLPKFEELVKTNKGHFVNGKLTWVDFYFATMSETIGNMLKVDLLKDYPSLKALQDKVMALPAIKAWVAKRPETQM